MCSNEDALKGWTINKERSSQPLHHRRRQQLTIRPALGDFLGTLHHLPHVRLPRRAGVHHRLLDDFLQLLRCQRGRQVAGKDLDLRLLGRGQFRTPGFSNCSHESSRCFSCFLTTAKTSGSSSGVPKPPFSMAAFVNALFKARSALRAVESFARIAVLISSGSRVVISLMRHWYHGSLTRQAKPIRSDRL